MQKHIHNFRLPQMMILLAGLLVAAMGSHVANCQTCCLTSSITINTGYDPATGSTVTPISCNGCSHAPDPHWKVYSVSPDMQAAIAGDGYAYLSPGSYADVIPAEGVWATYASSNYITCFNSQLYTYSGAAGGYNMVLYREFTLCTAACVALDVNIADDNWIGNINIDGGTNLYSEDSATSHFSPFSNLTTTVCALPAGTHTLYVTVHEDFSGWNPAGLNIFGTISTSTAAIIGEGAGCSPSWAFCSEPAITGDDFCCAGYTKTLSNSFTGGTWSSSDGSIASIDAASGIYTGVTGGTATITYTDLCGRAVTYPVTINATPAITSGYGVCIGYTTTLTATPAGGSWSVGAGSGSVTVGSATGIVTGIALGSVPFTYTAATTGCSVTGTEAINPLPAPITGIFTVCAGANTFVLDAGGGTGTWSSSNTNATVSSVGGTVYGAGAGTATITYTTAATGCYTTQPVTVNPAPAAITGPSAVCGGSSITLSDDSTGGVWTTGSGSAGVGSATGIVTGALTGYFPDVATITYTLPAGCATTTTVTINALPYGITGTTTVCVGAATTLSDGVGGGSWSAGAGSGSVSVGSATGVVTGMTAGTATVTYTSGAGCAVTTSVTVNPSPAPVTGVFGVCAGFTTPLSDVTPGGSWSAGAGSGSVAVGSATGIVSGTAAGAAAVTYTLAPDGCMSTAAVTVNPLPAAIGGAATVCAGASITLSDDSTGGMWSAGAGSGSVTAGSVTGLITGVTAGTATITYTLPAGCLTTTTVTVYPSPSYISGDGTVCAGDTTALSSLTAGGTWSIGDASIAAVITGTAGCNVAGITAGNTVLSYTNTYGCYVIRDIYVGVLPIMGAHNVCAYAPVTFYTETVTDATPGGAWTAALVTISASGGINSYAAGTAIVIYTIAGHCAYSDTFTVYPLPAPITGGLRICGTGSTTTLSTVSTGGMWSATAGSGSVTVGSASGIVTGVTPGTADVTYTFPTGCTQTVPVTVNATISAVSGTAAVCIGATTTLSATPSGGVWSESAGSGSVTVGSATGVVTGVGPGTATVAYSLAGCSSGITVTVDALPDAITGDTAVCQGSAITLGDATTGGHWSAGAGSGSVTVGSATGVVTGLGAGTAMVTYTLGTGCMAIDTVAVNDTTGSCTPCEVFTHRAYTALGPSIGTSTLSGYYYLPNNATISGTVNVTDAVVLIAPGVTISVNPTAELLVNGSHLQGGCDMWNGIALLNDGLSHTGRVVFDADGSGISSLVEDAVTAGMVISPVGSATEYVKCDNAVFNRNHVGLDIETYSSSSSSYPFLFRNTVFTSRDFSGYPGYPFAWPQATGAGGLKTLITPVSVLYPPFNISTAYSGAYLKSGYEAYAGINMAGVGYTGAGYAFSDITVGDTTQTLDNQYMNLFDNLNYGIMVNNTNLTSVNNAFINMVVHEDYFEPYYGGDGIYATTSGTTYSYNRLQVYSPNGNPYHNQFYNFLNGVECYNYFRVIGQYNFMINSGTGTFLLPAALYGYLIKTPKYDTISILYDTISNAGTGVGVWATYVPLGAVPPGGVAQYTGYCKVDSNVIQASPLGYAVDMTQSMNLAITIQNTLTSTPPPPASTTALAEVNGNYLNDVANGIFVNNFARQTMNTNGNTISLRPNARKELYYGINHTLCHGSQMYDNYVTTSAGTTGGDSMRAYYAASTLGTGIYCNAEENTGRGFEFFLQNHGATWHHNDMTNNLKGYVLNGATIGTQHYGGHPIDNEWLGSTWGSSNPQTYVYHGANATQDTIYVYAAPAYNGGNPHPDEYSTLNGSIQVQPDYYPSPCPIVYNNHHDFQDAERVAQKRILYAYNTIPNNWIAQNELWNSIVADTSLKDSSVIIAKFASLAANSRYKYLTDIDSTLATGDYADATIMLGYNIDSIANTEIDTVTGVQMADDTEADYIVADYQAFYGLYIAYMQGTLASADSLQIMALAQLCPEINGNVVFQARALYSNIYNDLSVFSDDSCLDVDTAYIAERGPIPPDSYRDSTGEGGVAQAYQVFPNPNDGNFVIQQHIPDGNPVAAEIEDVLGRTVYKETLLFPQAKSALDLNNVAPGIYLLKLKDSGGNSFMFKFVVE